MLRLICCWLIVLLSLTPGAPLFADDPARSEQTTAGEALLESAKSAFSQGRYAEALQDFEQALARLGRPTIHYDIAEAAARLGNHERAIGAYRDYLAAVPAAPDRESVRQRIAAENAKLDARVEPLAADLSPSAAAGTEAGSVDMGSGELAGARNDYRNQGLFWLWTGIGVAVVATVVAAVVVTNSDDPPQPPHRGAVGGTIQTLEAP